MTTIKHLVIQGTAACLLLLTSACNNESGHDDAREMAEEQNERNLSNEVEEDAEKLVELYNSNLYEVKCSEEAATRASSPEVKQLASMMAQSHSKMTGELQQLANKKGITLPADLSNEQMRDLDKLKEKSGLDYDKEYLEQMKNEHKNAVDKLENISEKAADADIRQFASNALPEIRSHQDMVEATRNIIKDKKDNTKAKKDKKDGEHAYYDRDLQ